MDRILEMRSTFARQAQNLIRAQTVTARKP
jgi:hypothetical protein